MSWPILPNPIAGGIAMAIAIVHIIIIKTNILQESRLPASQKLSPFLMMNSRIIDSVTVQ